MYMYLGSLKYQQLCGFDFFDNFDFRENENFHRTFDRNDDALARVHWQREEPLFRNSVVPLWGALGARGTLI